MKTVGIYEGRGLRDLFTKDLAMLAGRIEFPEIPKSPCWLIQRRGGGDVPVYRVAVPLGPFQWKVVDVTDDDVAEAQGHHFLGVEFDPPPPPRPFKEPPPYVQAA